MKLKLTLATKNPGKLSELHNMSTDNQWLELLLAPDSFSCDETGSTYMENAIIKAKEAARLTGNMAVADDSGLEVESLSGRPGLYSARYCQGSESLGRKKLLEELLSEQENRNARFVCAIAICKPGDSMPVFETEAYWNGRISFTEAGSQGFGFDPIFIPEGYDVTAAQISSKEKNHLSHRGQAWRKTLKFLEKNFIQA